MERVAIGLLGLGTVGSGVARLLVQEGERIARRAGRRIDLKWAVVRDPSKPREAPTGRCPDRDRPPASPGRPRGGDRGRDDGRDGPDLADRPRRPGGRQARRHGQQGPAGRARARGLRPGAEGGPRGRLRGERRRRHPDRPGARGLAGGQPGPGPGGDPQRDLQLHPDVDDPRAASPTTPPCRQAQDLGYAEADPTLDVDGTDTAHKLAILAQLAFGAGVTTARDPPRGDRPAAPGRHHATPPSWATPSSSWPWPSCRSRAWSCGSRRRWSSTGRPWPRSAGRTTPSGSWATRWATRSSTAEAPGRCRPPRPSSAT